MTKPLPDDERAERMAAVTAEINAIRERTTRLLADCLQLQPTDDAALIGLAAVRTELECLVELADLVLMDAAKLEDRERGLAVAMRRIDEITALMDRTQWLVTPSPSVHLN